MSDQLTATRWAEILQDAEVQIETVEVDASDDTMVVGLEVETDDPGVDDGFLLLTLVIKLPDIDVIGGIDGISAWDEGGEPC